MTEREGHSANAERATQTVLLTGARGFVGSHLRPALLASGYRVRCGSRQPSASVPDREQEHWVRVDLGTPETLGRALSGCTSAIYLVHEVGSGKDYPERERRAAEAFVRAAAVAGLERIVYVGGVAPTGERSRHLESRLQVGRVLRAGGVATVELRCAMIIGRGSASWQIIRDLAVRLPVMVLPRWLDHLSCPVAVEDVIAATLIGLDPSTPAGWFEVPGPECLSHRELLARVARLFGGRFPRVYLPKLLTPALLGHWIALITRVDLSLVRELLPGLLVDLLPQGTSIWSKLPGHRLRTLDQAIMAALEDETSHGIPSTRAVSRLCTVAERVAAELRTGNSNLGLRGQTGEPIA